MKTRILSSGLATLLASSLHGVIVYQDNFDAADGIGTNANIGGGLISGTNIAAANPFDDASGNALAQTNFGNRVAWAHTTSQFDLSSGFTLDVTFTTAALGTEFPSFVSSFGIVDEVTAATPDASDIGGGNNINAFLYSDQADLNAVGFSAANRPTHTSATDEGVYTDFGTLAQASSDLNTAIAYGTTQTFSMTVNADGSSTFSLDGASGNLPTGALSSLFTDSADGEYHFVAYSQGNPGFTLNSVSIDAVSTIPEPSSFALLGLGGLALLRRRR